MKKLSSIIITVMTTFAWSCDKPAEQDYARDIAEIRALSANRANAFNQGNAAGIANAFTEEGMLMAPDKKAATGRLAVR